MLQHGAQLDELDKQPIYALGSFHHRLLLPLCLGLADLVHHVKKPLISEAEDNRANQKDEEEEEEEEEDNDDNGEAAEEKKEEEKKVK